MENILLEETKPTSMICTPRKGLISGYRSENIIGAPQKKNNMLFLSDRLPFLIRKCNNNVTYTRIWFLSRISNSSLSPANFQPLDTLLIID